MESILEKVKSNIVIIRTIKDNIISSKEKMKSNAENMETTLYDTPNNTGCKHTQQLSASVQIGTDAVAVITITVPIKNNANTR